MRKLISFLLCLTLLNPLGWCGASKDYDGADDITNFGNRTILTNIGAQTRTAWIYPRSRGEGNLGVITRIGTSGAVFNRWSFDSGTTNALIFTWACGSATFGIRVTSANTITLNRWSFVAMTWDGSITASNVHIYINGVEPSYATTTSGISSVLSDSGSDLTVGNNHGATQSFDGNIAYVNIYNKILTTDEMKDIMFREGSVFRGLIFSSPLLETTGAIDPDLSGNNSTGTCTTTGCPRESANGPPIYLSQPMIGGN